MNPQHVWPFSVIRDRCKAALLCYWGVLLLSACSAQPIDSQGEQPETTTSAITVTPGAPWVARHGLSATDYQSEFNKWVGQGYRLTYVSGYSVNNQATYAAIWQQAPSAPWVARHGLTA